MTEFEIGDKVEFVYNGETQNGTVIEVSQNGVMVSFADEKKGLSFNLTIHPSRLTKI